MAVFSVLGDSDTGDGQDLAHKVETKPGVLPKTFFKEVFPGVRVDTHSIVFVHENQVPPGARFAIKPYLLDMFAMPHRIFQEVIEDFFKERICKDLGRSAFTSTSKGHTSSNFWAFPMHAETLCHFGAWTPIS